MHIKIFKSKNFNEKYNKLCQLKGFVVLAKKWGHCFKTLSSKDPLS
jgi:hypothetical protein